MAAIESNNVPSWNEEDHYKFLGITQYDALAERTEDGSNLFAIFTKNSRRDRDGVPLSTVDTTSTMTVDTTLLVSAEALQRRRVAVTNFNGSPNLTNKAITSFKNYTPGGEDDLGDDFLHSINPEVF